MDEDAKRTSPHRKPHGTNGRSRAATEATDLPDEEEFQASIEALNRTREKIEEIEEKRRELAERDRQLELRIAALEAAIRERNREIQNAKR